MRTLSSRTIKIHLGARKNRRAIFFAFLTWRSGTEAERAARRTHGIIAIIKECVRVHRAAPEDRNSGEKRERASAMILLSPNKTKSRPHLNELANFALGKSIFAPRLKVVLFRGVDMGCRCWQLGVFVAIFHPVSAPQTHFFSIWRSVCAHGTPKLGQVTSSVNFALSLLLLLGENKKHTHKMLPCSHS